MRTQVIHTRNVLRQMGGTFLGIIVGLLLGLGIALAVAIYITKVPVPFSGSTAPKNGAEKDAEEAQKNKNWNPNASLQGKPPAKPPLPAAPESPPPAVPAVSGSAAPAAPSPSPAGSSSAPKAASPSSTPSPASPPPTKPSADPLGDLAKAKDKASSAAVVSSSTASAEPFVYFVQAGAYRTADDAQAQKAKLTMAGFEAKVTEREQSGRVVFRVRVGPIEKKDDAEKTKEKMGGAGFEAALVRVQR